MHVPTSEAFRRGRRNGYARARALPGKGILSGSIIGGLVGFGRGGNYLDFHIGSSWQRGNLNGGTGRRIFFEIRAVDLVYRLKVAEVGEENGCLNDMIKSQAFHL